MKNLYFLLLSIFTTIAVAQTPCENNSAAGFPCENFDLQSKITLGEMNASKGNDSWGWTDPQDGKEYALIGLDNGTAFIDISDPINPIYLGKLPTHTDPSTWRDVKVYNNYAFIVSEAFGHGMQVFDLTRLRNVANPPESFTEDAHYDGFGSAHNIVINEESGYAFPVGTRDNNGNQQFNGGPHFINIQNPLSPIGEGGYAMDNYSHDAQVVTYTGPDTDYAGKEILIGSNANEVVIVDITNKNTPQGISTINYSNVGYTHQGWFTEDQKYFILGDETDELTFGFNTRTIVFDFSDLENPQIHTEYLGSTSATDHNGYVLGDKFYLANYNAGLSVLDISDIENQNITQYGYFDTYPSNNNAGFNGSWNVYPFFESGNIIISGEGGFTLVKDSNILSVEDVASNDFALYPNPAKEIITIASPISPLNQVEVYSVLGKRVLNFEFPNTNLEEEVNIASLQSGIYLVKINNLTTKRLIVN